MKNGKPATLEATAVVAVVVGGLLLLLPAMLLLLATLMFINVAARAQVLRFLRPRLRSKCVSGACDV